MEPGWLDMVEQDVRQLVRGTFLESAPLVRTSATTGAGIDELKRAIGDVCARVDEATAGDLFRLAVDRAFVVQGRGTVVTGTVWSGGCASATRSSGCRCKSRCACAASNRTGKMPTR
jgi:selenocysteine-specific elongation factor